MPFPILVTINPATPRAFDSKRVLRLDALSRLLDVSKSTIHRLRREDTSFPKPFLISKQAVGFDLAEIEEWIERRKSARSQVVTA